MTTPGSPIPLTDRPYLFADETLVERHEGTRLVQHSPKRQEPVFYTDAPWEGITSAYFIIVDTGDRYLLYYRGSTSGDDYDYSATCVAESEDGIDWERRLVWKHTFAGSKANNIVWAAEKDIAHNMAPFFDTNPDCDPDSPLKAVGGLSRYGLFLLGSKDGFNWRLLREEPIMTKEQGAFDSLNTAFWDSEQGCYVAYFRTFSRLPSGEGVRDISRAVSDDLIHWSDQQPIGLGDKVPHEHFYTNAIKPYLRDPGLYLGFPKRFVPSRTRHADHGDNGVSDSVLLVSRDGVNFPRLFREAFVRPGPDQSNWTERNLMMAPGMVQTSPTEISLYWTEHYRHYDHHLMRGTIRVDGFASLQGEYPGGVMTSVPVKLTGEKLIVNMATAAPGTVKIEILDKNGQPIPGFSGDAADELFGDDIDRVVTWNGNPDVAKLKGEAVRLRIFVECADVYAVWSV